MSDEYWIIDLQNRVKKLEEGIKRHASQKGHNLCWENDQELYSLVGLTEYPSKTLPPKEEFLSECQKYYETKSFEKKALEKETKI